MSVPVTRSCHVFMPVIRVETGNVLINAYSSKAPGIQQIYVPSASPNKSLSRHALSPLPVIQLNANNHRKRSNPFDEEDDEQNLHKKKTIKNN